MYVCTFPAAMLACYTEDLEAITNARYQNVAADEDNEHWSDVYEVPN